MKKTEFEFKRYRFDFKMPLLSDSPTLVEDQRNDILDCFAQLKEKTNSVVNEATIVNHGDLEKCFHLFKYYKLAMLEVDASERRYKGLIDRADETESTRRFYEGRSNRVD